MADWTLVSNPQGVARYRAKECPGVTVEDRRNRYYLLYEGLEQEYFSLKAAMRAGERIGKWEGR